MKNSKSIGLIAELNPFHLGHKTYLKNAFNLDKYATFIMALSPNFVQRGEVAIYPKYKRVKDALKNGVDIVVEIPTIFAVQSADIYAKYSLDILNEMMVDEIVFGTESGDTDLFLNKFKNKEFNNPRVDEIIEDLMDKGYSYPYSKAKAIQTITDFYLENPNDILGFEYVKNHQENKYKFKINCYKRDRSESNSSASKIRSKKAKQLDIFNRYNFNSKYFDLLKYILLTKSSIELDEIHLIEEGIQNLFKKNIVETDNMDDFVESCVSKRYSRARIKRTIIHILLNTKKTDAKKYLDNSIPYLRILGFSSKGAKYLRLLEKQGKANIVTRFSAQDNPLLLEELKATALYNFNKNPKQLNKELEKEKRLYPIQK